MLHFMGKFESLGYLFVKQCCLLDLVYSEKQWHRCLGTDPENSERHQRLGHLPAM